MPSVPFMAMLVGLTLAKYVKGISSAQAHG